MRKKTVVLCISLLILCLAPMQIFGLDAEQKINFDIGPLWVSITDFQNTFDISASGAALVNSKLYARSNINKVVINASIQQYINGSWKTIKSWTSTSSSNSGYLNQTWYVMSGYYYRMVSTGAVYQNGVLVEQTFYTSPSYWY